MDLALLKTFLSVAETGSFAAASDRLFVTQSAVSLRIQRLEDQLGRLLFTRSKAGAELTPSGREFEGYAISLVRNWEKARQQVAVPDGFTRTLTLGAQVSLWPRLGFRWVDALRNLQPDLGIRAEVGTPEQLTRAMSEGVMQIALTYTPTLRPGMTVEKVMEEDLVLVARWEDPDLSDLRGRYVYIDWGEDFFQFHNRALPNLSNPGLTLAMGALAARYLIDREFAAYLPARYVKRYVDREQMFLVPGAPVYTHTAWSVWRDDLEEELGSVAEETLKKVVETAETDMAEIVDLV
ncbi:LysR family transcriptional regulator [Ostreiculturibacter nitratireducens]|uniref:LysR family transcriptional regulator n=1 Tax=Ostreiculturibacter nitratireducens TaxID=3075226 RepID=UPI0031B5EDCC